MEVSENKYEADASSDGASKLPFLGDGDVKKPSEDRITMLSDGIFAIAVTLLVLDIQIPPEVDHTHFLAALTGDFLESTIFYAITFAILAAYWMNHRRLMSVIERLDGPFLWLNLLFLAFVAFFPVVSNLLKFSQFAEAVVVYTVVLTCCGYSSLILWIYAFANYRLVAKDKKIRLYLARFIGVSTIPTFLLLTLLLLFLPYFQASPSHIFYVWIILPFVNMLWIRIARLLFKGKRAILVNS
jgi:uncharacterized membrane protein